MKTIGLIIVGVFLLLEANALLAEEIYRCRSQEGGIVFSDKPCLQQAYQGTTEAHKVWREIGEIARLGEAMNTLRGSSVADRAQCKEHMTELRERITVLKPQVDELHERYYMIEQAYEELPKCVSCGQSATYYCRESEKLRNTAANELHLFSK